MKAIMLRELGGPHQLKYEEVPHPEPGSQDVIVRLHAAALNRRDVFVTYGQYPGIQLPAIPGSDGAGVVVAVGDGVSDVEVGNEILINPSLNWGDDIQKKSPDYETLGVPTDGTFAQYVKIPAKYVYQKPEHLSWEEGAALPLAGLTAYRALVTKGQVQAGENVLIPGVGGGVATLLVQFASALGARVFVTSSKDEKIEKAKELGAVDGINYTADGWAKQLKKQTGGIDLSLDSIGGDVFNALISLGRIGSRIVTFGATKGPVPQLVMPRLFLKEIAVYGSTMGSPQEFRDMLDLVERHRIRPVLDKTYPLEQAVEALVRLEKGQNFGKIALSIPLEE